MLAILVLLGVGSEAAIPIALTAIFYPTLRFGAGRVTRRT
jgi:hypothetical protein